MQLHLFCKKSRRKCTFDNKNLTKLCAGEFKQSRLNERHSSRHTLVFASLTLSLNALQKKARVVAKTDRPRTVVAAPSKLNMMCSEKPEALGGFVLSLALMVAGPQYLWPTCP